MSLEPDYVLTNNPHVINSLDFGLIDGKNYMFCGDDAGNISIWNLIVYKRVKTLKDSNLQSINKLSFLNDTLIAQSKDVIKLWQRGKNEFTFNCIKTYHLPSISMACFSAIFYLNRLIIAVPEAITSELITFFVNEDEISKTLNLIATEDTKLGTIVCIHLSNLTNLVMLLVGFESGLLKIALIKPEYVLQGNSSTITSEIHDLRIFEDMITCLDFDSSRYKGVCGTVFNYFKVFQIQETENSVKINILKNIYLPNPGLSSIVIRPDSLIIASAGWDHLVTVFSWKSLKKLAILNYHKQSIKCIQFSPQTCTNKFILAISSADKTISLWSPYN